MSQRACSEVNVSLAKYGAVLCSVLPFTQTPRAASVPHDGGVPDEEGKLFHTH